MSPTIFRSKGFAFFFYSLEEARLHVHVRHADGEAKFWLEPTLTLATSRGLDARQLRAAARLIREHEMRSEPRGKSTSDAEVINVSPDGVRMVIDGRERFLPFRHFPWFEEASIREIANVERIAPDHLRWPDLDVDLSLESIDHPERFPLVSRRPVSQVRERRKA